MRWIWVKGQLLMRTANSHFLHRRLGSLLPSLQSSVFRLCAASSRSGTRLQFKSSFSWNYRLKLHFHSEAQMRGRVCVWAGAVTTRNKPLALILGVGAFSAEFACSSNCAPGFLSAPKVNVMCVCEKSVWVCSNVTILRWQSGWCERGNYLCGERLSWLVREVINRPEKLSECVRDLVTIFVVGPL